MPLKPEWMTESSVYQELKSGKYVRIRYTMTDPPFADFATDFCDSIDEALAARLVVPLDMDMQIQHSVKWVLCKNEVREDV